MGMQAREGRELALAAEAVGVEVHSLEFGSPLADAALAAHGPGSVRLPLAIVAGRYSLQRPAFGAVLECIEVLPGSRQTLPTTCVVLGSTADLEGQERRALEPTEVAATESLASGDLHSPDRQDPSDSAPKQTEADARSDA